jgi:hypothetical protein
VWLLLLTTSTRSRENCSRNNARARRVRIKKGSEILLLAGHNDSPMFFELMFERDRMWLNKVISSTALPMKSPTVPETARRAFARN